MIVFRRVRSVDDSSILLEWVGLGGEVKQWLFSAYNEETTSTTFKSISSISAYRGIPNKNARQIDLKTLGLSEQEYDFVKDLQFTNLVLATRGGLELPAGISSIKVKELRPLKLRDFSLTITLQSTLQMTN